MRRRPNEVRLSLQRHTARGLRLLEGVEVREVAVDQGSIREWPQMLCRLQLRRIGGQEEQVEVVGHPQARTRVPARPVEDQHDLLVGTGSHLAREFGQFHLEERNGDAGGQVEDGASGGRVHEADQVAPSVAMLDGRQWASVVECRRVSTPCGRWV